MTCFGHAGRNIFIAACSLIAASVLLIPLSAGAHGIAGKRFFPTTFAVDDPFVSDEFSVLYNFMKMPGDAGGPTVQTQSLSVEYSKRITSGFGLAVAETYLDLHPLGDGSVSGFGNLEANAKYQFFTSAEHETIMSFGVSDEIGHTGSAKVGAEAFSIISPALSFGKGFGDLPDSIGFLRPFAITGIIGPNFPTRGTTSTQNNQGGVDVTDNPTTLTWAFTVQYSLMYYESFVKDLGLGTPFNRMVAVVEFPNETCLNGDCKNQTTSTINPGLAWIGKDKEFGLAAQIPLNTRSGKDIGVFALFHLFLDDLFPTGIGRPVIH